MAVKKKRKKRVLKPRVPSRVKKRRGTKRAHGRYSELYGLGLLAGGLFLGIVLYGGWNGGIVGGPLSDSVHGFVGAAAYLVPLAFVAVGGLMVARSELVDFRPFRVGLGVLSFGLLTTLGTGHGGFLGWVFGGGLGTLLGPGAPILGILALTASTGGLITAGASGCGLGVCVGREGRFAAVRIA